MALLMLSGCGSSKEEAQSFWTSLRREQAVQRGANDNFAANLVGFVKGTSDKAALRSAYYRLAKLAKQSETTLSALKVPSSSSAQELYKATQSYARAAMEWTAKEYLEAVRIAEDEGLSLDVRKQRIVQIGQRIDQAQKPLWEALQRAEDDFVKEHKLEKE